MTEHLHFSVKIHVGRNRKITYTILPMVDGVWYPALGRFDGPCGDALAWSKEGGQWILESYGPLRAHESVLEYCERVGIRITADYCRVSRLCDLNC